MNIQQLQYIIAVDRHRQFVTAAKKCYVTQATLSMMIRKLEDELGVKIFDRSKQPVTTTPMGEKIIAQAKRILQQVDQLHDIVAAEQNEVKGDLRLGIIPTLAPYLLPLFMNTFLQKYASLHLKVEELTTDEILRKIDKQDIDIGILAIPVNRPGMVEISLFYEEFVVFGAAREKLMQKKYVMAKDIDIDRLWLLEEGHCLRSQVINLCELKKREKETHQLDFAAGSIETLKRIVETNQGMTILPQLALKGMTAKQKQNIRYFRQPPPVREIGLVMSQHFVKEKTIQSLKAEILRHIPAEMIKSTRREVISIES